MTQLLCTYTNQARRVHEEYFLPGEEIIEQGSAADQVYFVATGSLVSSFHNVLVNLQLFLYVVSIKNRFCMKLFF